MRFSSDAQRRAVFAHLNSFSSRPSCTCSTRFSSEDLMSNMELKRRIDDAAFEIARKLYKDLGGSGDFGAERDAEIRRITHDYLNWYADEYKNNSDVVSDVLDEYNYPSVKDFKSDMTSNNDFMRKLREAVIPFENINPGSFEDASNKVSTLNSYGVHTEVPEEDSYMFNWSNGMRGWYVWNQVVKAGETVSVDANQFLYPKKKVGSKSNATALAMTLPELPLYYGSFESGERGEVTPAEKFKIWAKGHDETTGGMSDLIPTDTTTIIIPNSEKFRNKIVDKDEV